MQTILNAALGSLVALSAGSAQAQSENWIEDVQLSRVATTLVQPARSTNLDVQVAGGNAVCKHRIGTKPWSIVQVSLTPPKGALMANHIPATTAFRMKVDAGQPGKFKVQRPRDELTLVNYRQAEWVMRVCLQSIYDGKPAPLI